MANEQVQTSAFDELAFIPNVGVYGLIVTFSVCVTATTVAFIFDEVGLSTVVYICIAIFCIATVVMHAYASRKIARAYTPKLNYLLRGGCGEALTAVLSGATRFSDVRRWLDRTKIPTKRQLKRIDFAFETLIPALAKTPEELRCWLVSANIGSDRISPAEAIRADRFDEVTASIAQLAKTQKGHIFMHERIARGL